MKIAAVIVTFNRLNLLKECIEAIRNQTKKVDEIVVINNSSTDGTLEWLLEQNDLTIITQENSGSAGGQYIGIKYAYEKGYDWIWCMDDDVLVHSDCLKELLKANKRTNLSILQPVRYYNDNVFVKSESKDLDFKNIFREHKKEFVTIGDIKTNDVIIIKNFPFEGVLINKCVIEKIGLPNKGYFIIADDTDYSIRSLKAGFEIGLVSKAILFRQIKLVEEKKFTLKSYYYMRNTIILDRFYGNFCVSVLRPFIYLLKKIKWCIIHKCTIDEYSLIFQAFFHGISKKMGDYKNIRINKLN